METLQNVQIWVSLSIHIHTIYTYTYSKDCIHLYLYEYHIHTIGKCNRKTGDCECNKGYTGAACERLLCPVGVTSRNAIQPCSGYVYCCCIHTYIY